MAQLDFEKIYAINPKPFIATPCIGGRIEIEMVQGLLGFQALCYATGIKNEISFLTNEALISRARNHMVAEFMCSDCTHLFFIDSDEGFEGLDILTLISRKKEIISAPVPKKSIDLEYACSFVGDESGKVIRDDECKDLIELGHAGTGFVCIERGVIEKMIEEYPELHYDNTYGKGQFIDNNPDLSTEKMKKYTYALFDTYLEDHSYYGEDNTFSKRWRDMGGRIWLDTTVNVSHVGRKTFTGDLRLFEKI